MKPAGGVMQRAAIRSIALFFLLACAPLADAASLPANLCPPSLVKGVPVRPPSAETGTDFIQRVADLDESAREKVIAADLKSGDIPDFLRRLKPVRVQGELPSGRIVTITVCVMPDYLAIGGDRDFVRVPMRLSTALLVAARFGFVLPTARIVDAIYDQAEVRLPPQPLPPTDAMRSTGYYLTHDALVSAQLAVQGAAPGALVAGDKKDLVLTNELRAKPEKIAIYGWHVSSGHPIQPLSLWHGKHYADYSHGVRLVSQIVLVNGMQRSFHDVMGDPKLAPIISDEGPIPFSRDLMAQLGRAGPASTVAASPPEENVLPAQRALLQLIQAIRQ
jgi:hypothetical protein